MTEQRCGQHGCAFSVRLVVNGQRDEYCPECEIDRLRAALATAQAELDRAHRETSKAKAETVRAEQIAHAEQQRVEQAEAALATAQAERDAARQEAAAVQAAHDATAQRYNMAIDRLHAEKDAMSRDGSSLRASLAHPTPAQEANK